MDSGTDWRLSRDSQFARTDDVGADMDHAGLAPLSAGLAGPCLRGARFRLLLWCGQHGCALIWFDAKGITPLTAQALFVVAAYRPRPRTHSRLACAQDWRMTPIPAIGFCTIGFTVLMALHSRLFRFRAAHMDGLDRCTALRGCVAGRRLHRSGLEAGAVSRQLQVWISSSGAAPERAPSSKRRHSLSSKRRRLQPVAGPRATSVHEWPPAWPAGLGEEAIGGRCEGGA